MLRKDRLTAKGPDSYVRLIGGAGETIDNGLRPTGEKEHKLRLPLESPSCCGEVGLCYPRTLNHRVVGIGDFGCGLSLSFLGAVGFDIDDFALAVEGDNLDHILHEVVVGVERTAEVVANVCHDFEV